MRLVLGLSLTASSAVWVLVDLRDGNILAEEVVASDGLPEMARAAALSVQAFEAQTEHDIDGVRLTWTDDVCDQGVRLTSKLRLFGFEKVETVSAEAAREGRNKTARYLAPHLDLAYGAARADRGADGSRSVFHRLADRVPARFAPRVPVELAARVPARVAVASCAAVAAAAAVGVGVYALAGSSPSEVYPTAAEPDRAQAGTTVAASPTAAPPKPVVPWSAADPAAVPAPTPTPEPVDRWLPETAPAAQPATPLAVPDVSAALELDSTEPAAVPATAGVPHLSGAQPAQAAPLHGTAPGRGVGPVPPAARPVTQPVTSAPLVVLPDPLPPVLSSLFDALP